MSSNAFFDIAASGDMYIGTSSGNQNICIGSSNNAMNIKISSNGFVGIGTSNAQYTLDVNGIISMSSNLVCSNLIKSTMPYFAYKLNTNLVINSLADFTLVFNTLDVNQGDHGLSYNSSTGLFTNVSGSTNTYLVSYMASWTPINSTGTRVTWIGNSNQVLLAYRQGLQNQKACNDYTCNSTSCYVTLSNNEYFSLKAWQNSGSTLNLGNGSRIQILRI